MTEAFVYCWTDHATQKLYIGSHKGSIDDGYVCSSKYMMEEYSKRSENFTRQIVASGKEEDIRKFETKLLTALDAASDESFYNKHNGFGTNGINYGKYLSIDEKKLTYQKVASALKDKPKSDNHKQAMRGSRPHVNQSCSKNNNARKICTPHGVFESIIDCSKTLNIAYNNVYYKLRSKHKGWEYI